MKSGSFLCTKVNGKLKIFDRAGFDAVLAEYGDGEDIQLELDEPAARKRTRAQEKYFHGPVLKAFEHFGYHKQEAKDMLCLRFIPKEIHQMDGEVVIVPGRTSTLTVEEYNDLIEQCIQLAAENGQIVLDGAEWRARHRNAA